MPADDRRRSRAPQLLQGGRAEFFGCFDLDVHQQAPRCRSLQQHVELLARGSIEAAAEGGPAAGGDRSNVRVLAQKSEQRGYAIRWLAQGIEAELNKGRIPHSGCGVLDHVRRGKSNADDARAFTQRLRRHQVVALPLQWHTEADSTGTANPLQRQCPATQQRPPPSAMLRLT